jgi:general secretion pathway protein G
MRHRDRAGFSLVEVLIALVIVAILGGVVALNLVGATDEAKITGTRSQIQVLSTGLKLYQAQQGNLPTQGQGLDALVQAATQPPVPPRFPPGGYLDSRTAPNDAWGRPFLYLVPGRQGQPYEIISYGADGLSGGQGKDADLSSAD